MNFSVASTLVGGFGLFLLALGMMTEGLKLAAGSRLKTILEWGTTPAWRGLLSGIGITVLVQASGAVTLSAIGFVNAGLMSLSQSLAVIFGTNVGTTVTGWLVSLVGFEFDIAMVALPLIGAGTVFRLVSGSHPRGGLGWALAGFGLFFLGLDYLKDGFQALTPEVPLRIVADHGIWGLLASLAVGLVVTVLAQSSSAAVALVLTAAQSGMMGLASAAAMVIGANIGTTSTALIATIGATPNAKRVALAHVIFNVATGAVALGLLMAVLAAAPADGLDGILAPAAFLALFHTAFNVLGVALMWPLRDRLAGFLARRFRSADEDLARPVFLDPHVARIPALGGMAILNEVARIAALTREGVTAAARDGEAACQGVVSRHHAVARLVVEVGHFATRVQQGAIGAEQSRALSDCLRICQYYAEGMEMAERLQGLPALLAGAGRREELAAVAGYLDEWLALMEDAAPRGPNDDLPPPDQDRAESVVARYHETRQCLIDAAIQERLDPETLSAALERLTEMNRLAKRFVKAARIYRKAAGAFIGT